MKAIQKIICSLFFIGLVFSCRHRQHNMSSFEDSKVQFWPRRKKQNQYSLKDPMHYSSVNLDGKQQLKQNSESPEYLGQQDFSKLMQNAAANYPGVFSEPQSITEVHRIDERSPNEISDAGGFFPNPLKPSCDGDLYMHVKPHSHGSSCAVSFSSEIFEETLYSNKMFRPKSPVEVTWKQSRFDEAESKWIASEESHPIDSQGWDLLTAESVPANVEYLDIPFPVAAKYRLFQYHLKGIWQGIHVSWSAYQGGAFSQERELLLSHLPLGSAEVVKFREVSIVVDIELIGPNYLKTMKPRSTVTQLQFGAWVTLNSP